MDEGLAESNLPLTGKTGYMGGNIILLSLLTLLQSLSIPMSTCSWETTGIHLFSYEPITVPQLKYFTTVLTAVL